METMLKRRRLIDGSGDGSEEVDGSDSDWEVMMGAMSRFSVWLELCALSLDC